MFSRPICRTPGLNGLREEYVRADIVADCLLRLTGYISRMLNDKYTKKAIKWTPSNGKRKEVHCE